MPFQFGQQPTTPQQMPLATVPEAQAAAETREVLPVMPQLATPTHEESQSASKRHASESPGSVQEVEDRDIGQTAPCIPMS